MTKNEPDYRLFVVHMLVNLRRLGEVIPGTSLKMHPPLLEYLKYRTEDSIIGLSDFYTVYASTSTCIADYGVLAI